MSEEGVPIWWEENATRLIKSIQGGRAVLVAKPDLEAPRESAKVVRADRDGGSLIPLCGT